MVTFKESSRHLVQMTLAAAGTVTLTLVVGTAALSVPSFAEAASCDAIVGQWAWFIGGEVTVNRDGTFTQQSGNAGTWECNDGAQGRFTFRWRDGGFTNSLLLSPDGQGLTSTDTSQWYVTARRTGSAPIPQSPLVRKQDPASIAQPPPVQKPDPGSSGSAPSQQSPLVREENCCQEAYACEVKKIEAEFERKSAECRGQAGNALCFKAAVSTKASGLYAAGEKLRQCNRAVNSGVMLPGRTTGNQVPSGGLSPRDLPPAPSSSDEFHSTERTADPCQCIAWPDQVAGDVFDSDSPGADQGQPPPNPSGGGDTFGSDEPDCLPQIDAAVLSDIRAERNEILRLLAEGGYMTDLTLRTMGKLAAARLQHMTEPNEGIPARTARQARSTFEHAPENVVKAGQAVAKYLTNNSEANHRLLYGQVQAAVRRAEEDLKQKLSNPHITIAAVADSFLVGRVAGAAGTVCRQWSATKITQLKKTIEETRQAGKVVTQIKKDGSPKPVCGLVGSDRGPPRDCFWQTMAVATGDRAWFLRKEPPTWEQVYPILERHFGREKAKHPRTHGPGALQQIAVGRPVPVTQDEFVRLLREMPDNSEYMVFVHRPGDAADHVATLSKFGTQPPLLWDNQQSTSNMDFVFAGGESLSVFRYK